MITHSDIFTDKEDKPLTRSDVEKLLAVVGSSDKLNLTSRNLSNIDLSNFSLVKANLSGTDLFSANLSGANLSGANLFRADLTGALVSYKNFSTFLNYLQKSASFPQKSSVQATETDMSYNIRLQINEEPLTAQNFTSIMSAFTELHTKCWLIAHGWFTELIEYTQTHNERFAKEANLVIVKMTHNSPADIRVNVNADASIQGLADALKTGIDAITQTPHRRKAAELENQAAELALKQKELEVQTIQAEKEQNLQIVAQQAEINRQKGLLELQQQQIQVAKQQIDLDKERLALEINRLEFALETASKMVEMLRPGIDTQTKAMLLQTLIPNLLQTANGQGLVIALPEPKKEGTK